MIHREVGLTPVPSVTEDWIAAAFSPSFDRSRAQQIAISLSDELVDELISADDVVIGAPMYNFSITAGLKAWIDQIVRVGRTVEYPSYTGLLTGKSAVIIATRGGAGMGLGEPMEGLDAQVPYLRQILGFIGITDVSVIYAGSLAGSEEMRQASLDKARVEVETLAARLA